MIDPEGFNPLELILYIILYGLLIFFTITFGYYLHTGSNL